MAATEATTRQTQAETKGRLQMAAALRHPQYRNFWIGSLASLAGSQIMTLAQGWLVYDLTGSPLYLGYAGLATALPALGLSLIGGAMADRMDLRRLLFYTQAFMAVLTAILAALTLTGIVEPWHVLVVAFATGAANAFNNPARQSILPYLVAREDLMNAVSLNAMVWQGTRIIAPAAGGVVVAVAGTGVTFLLCATGYVIFSIVVLGLQLQGERRQTSASIFSDMGEGLVYVRRNSLFIFLIAMTFFNSFFGVSMLQILPAFAREVLDAGPSRLGLLFSAAGAGSVLGLTVTSSLGRFQRRGLLIIVGATAYGLFLVLFSQSTMYLLSLALIFTMSACSQVYMITVQTTLQLSVPDRLRGRVMGLYSMTYNMGPLGAMQAGAVAAAFGADVAVMVGGVAIMAFALGLTSLNPRVRNLRADAAPV